MGLNPLEVPDLTLITDKLIQMLKDAGLTSPPLTFNITVSGSAPDTVREDADCQLSLYLFHIEQDKFQLNPPVTGKRAQIVPFQPLALNLYYMLSASAGKNYAQEQQAMSIAMRCFNEH